MKVEISEKSKLMRDTFILVIFVMLFSMLLTGCATTIQTTVRRPAELDLAGAKTISVMYFSTEPITLDLHSVSDTVQLARLFRMREGKNYADLNAMSKYLTDAVTRKIYESEFFDVIGAEDSFNTLMGGRPVPCDVFLIGYFSNFVNEAEKTAGKESRIGNDDKLYVDEVMYYSRKVSLKITYAFIDAKSYHILATLSSSVYNKVRTKDRYALPSAFSVVQRQLDTVADEIMRKVQPYNATVNLTLLPDKTKDPQMKEANALAKSGQLLAAKELFLELYAVKNYMEAGYNAALIAQAQGDLDGAKTLMSEIVQKFDAPRAQSVLVSIEQEIKSRERLRQQMEQLESR